MTSISNPAFLPSCFRIRIFPILALLGLAGPSLAVEAERISREGPDEILATVTIDVSVAQVLTALEQPCHLRQWMPQLDRLEVLDTPAENQTLVYIATDIAWPFSPRDAITLFTRHDGLPIRLEMHSQPQAYPEVDGYARIPFSEGSWTLVAQEAGVTQVAYSQRVVPGGHIPQWLSDQAGVSQAKELLRALNRHVNSNTDMSCPESEHPPVSGRP